MTLAVLAVASLLLRLKFPWRIAAAHGLAVMLVMTASAHFAPSGLGFMPGHDDLAAMVPPFVPFPSLVVSVTGVLELLGALGLVLHRTRVVAGWCLAALLVCLLPANIHHADVPLWFRIPEQLVYLATAVVAARTRGRKVNPLGLSVKDSTILSSYDGSTSKS